MGGSITATYQTSATVIFDKPGYSYALPTIFAEITTVEVPVYRMIRQGACSVEPTYTYIEYPTGLFLDAYYY